MRKANVVVIERNQFLREGLRQCLRDTTNDVVAAVANARAAMLPTSSAQLDLLVWGPGTTDTVEAEIAWARSHLALSQRARLVVLMDIDDGPSVCRVVAQGVDAVLSSGISTEILLRSLELVMLGQQIFPAVAVQQQCSPSLTTPSFEPAALPKDRPAAVSWDTINDVGLSSREAQILQCLVNGSSNKAIARQLLVTEATVKAHVKGLLRKIRVSNRTQAAIWALSQAQLAGSPAFSRSPAIATEYARTPTAIQRGPIPTRGEPAQAPELRQHGRSGSRPQLLS